MHLLKVLDLPFGKLRDKGTPIDNVSNYNSSEENFVYLASLESLKTTKLFFGTKMSMLKLVEGAEFDVAKRTTAATKLKEGDEVLCVLPVMGNETLVMQSGKDMFLRIEVSSISEQKKVATGVRGMKLDREDALVNYYLLAPGANREVEVKGKTYDLNRLHIGNRDTKGTKK